MSATRSRDPRLDFFRGLAMFIIVVAHIPANPWTNWIPARFGFSDATEIFVFCSGMASAIAFGSLYARSGWFLGTVRVLFRVWQVYWAHIGTFVLIAATMVALNGAAITERDYVAQLNLAPFFREPAESLLGLLTLTYVPNYFDILPMYLVILALTPLVIVLADVHRGLVPLALGALWLAANLGQVSLPAEPWSERQWFFNPFGWQVLFFLGFGFMAGWLPPPPKRPALIALASAVVLLSVPLAHTQLREAVPGAADLWQMLRPLAEKTPLGPLRILHFLALAYLAWLAVGSRGVRLAQGRAWPVVTGVVQKVGQQSLAVFMTGLLVSRLLGVALDLLGRTWFAATLVNLAGMLIVAGTAFLVAWLKGAPWTRPRAGERGPHPDCRSYSPSNGEPPADSGSTKPASGRPDAVQVAQL